MKMGSTDVWHEKLIITSNLQVRKLALPAMTFSLGVPPIPVAPHPVGSFEDVWEAFGIVTIIRGCYKHLVEGYRGSKNPTVHGTVTHNGDLSNPNCPQLLN